MHVCSIASARATIGGPSFESRTACRKASFHRRTTLPPGAAFRALDAGLGNASNAAPAPAATRTCRRESGCSRAGRRDLLGPGGIDGRDGEVETSGEIAPASGPLEDDTVGTPSSRNAVMRLRRATLTPALLDGRGVAAGGVAQVE